MRLSLILAVLAVIAADAAAADTLFIPEVVRTRDAQGRTTKTDVTIRNNRAMPQNVELYFAEERYGQGDASIAGGFYLQLQPFETRTYEDVVDQMIRDEVTRAQIPAEGIRGRVFVTGIREIPTNHDDPERDPDASLSGSYRTSTDAAEAGTVSDSLDSIQAYSEPVEVFAKGTVTGLQQDADFKTDLVIWNGGNRRTFRITMKGSVGSQPATMSVSVEPNQALHAYPTWSHGALSVTVELISGQPNDGPWIAYGTTTDRRTGDSWTQQMVPEATVPTPAPGPPSEQLIIPVVADKPGAVGTHFKTDIAVTNHRNVDQYVRLRFFAVGHWFYGDPTYEGELLLRAGETLPVADVLTTALSPYYEFKGDLYGSLIISGDISRSGARDPDARISATYRIWTPPPSGTGTMSQSSAALDLDALPTGDVSRVAIGVRQDENFRCNVGVFSGAQSQRSFRVTATSTKGSVSTIITARGVSLTQVPLPAADLGYVTVTFEPLDSEATDLWTAYASSVDNRSGDSWLQSAYAD